MSTVYEGVQGSEVCRVQLYSSMLRRKRNSLASGNCTLRDEKEAMVCWAKRWSGHAALEGEQLDECQWQLDIEGRERSHGMCAGR
jgi:hypothetical protein